MINKKIKGIEKAKVIMGDWYPSALVAINSIDFQVACDGFKTNLVITALFQLRENHWPNFDKDMFRIQMSFNDVGGLFLKDFGGSMNQIMGFDIKYIGDRGLEDINFAIEDYEDGRIRFNCKEISIKSAELVIDMGF